MKRPWTKTVVTDIQVIVDVPRPWLGDSGSDWYQKHWENNADEFVAFVKDHRSADGYRAQVQKESHQVCTFCGREYEEDAEGPICCAQAQVAFDAQKALEEAAKCGT